jgi:hypothetical protein
VADGAPTAGAAFVRAAARETRPFLGDTWRFDRTTRLRRAATPLLETHPAESPVDRRARLRLTGAGRRVVAEDDDHVALNGVDRWIGRCAPGRPRGPVALERGRRGRHAELLLRAPAASARQRGGGRRVDSIAGRAARPGGRCACSDRC